MSTVFLIFFIMGNTSSNCSYCGNKIPSGTDLTYTKGVVIKARFCCKDCMYKWREENL